MLAILDGRRPKRPKSAIPMHLGFTETVWETVEQCWLEDRSARPDVKCILSRLSGVPSPRRTRKGMWVVRRGVGAVWKQMVGVLR